MSSAARLGMARSKCSQLPFEPQASSLFTSLPSRDFIRRDAHDSRPTRRITLVGVRYRVCKPLARGPLCHDPTLDPVTTGHSHYPRPLCCLLDPAPSSFSSFCRSRTPTPTPTHIFVRPPRGWFCVGPPRTIHLPLLPLLHHHHHVQTRFSRPLRSRPLRWWLWQTRRLCPRACEGSNTKLALVDSSRRNIERCYPGRHSALPGPRGSRPARRRHRTICGTLQQR